MAVRCPVLGPGLLGLCKSPRCILTLGGHRAAGEIRITSQHREGHEYPFLRQTQHIGAWGAGKEELV